MRCELDRIVESVEHAREMVKGLNTSDMAHSLVYFQGRRRTLKTEYIDRVNTGCYRKIPVAQSRLVNIISRGCVGCREYPELDKRYKRR